MKKMACIFTSLLFTMTACSNIQPQSDVSSIPEQTASETSDTLQPELFDTPVVTMNPEYPFTNGTESIEPTPLKIGDLFLDWTVTDLETIEENATEKYVSATFVGEVQIRGTLIYIANHPYYDTHATFQQLDTESQAKMPKAIDNTEPFYFAVDLSERLGEMIQQTEPTYEEYGSLYWEYPCEMVIQEYQCWSASFLNTAKIKRIVDISGLELPPELEQE